MATIVYIDGLNFYYGAVRGTPYKWLDYQALCARLLPRDQIAKIRYFTARVTPLPHDASAPARQGTYLRALETLPLVEIHYGHIVTRTRRLPLATPNPGSPRTVEVLATEEKRTDVNIASYLLLDAFTGACDTAVVVSNDSDLAEAIDIARNVAGIKVGVVNPHPARHRSRHMSATFFKQLRHGVLRQCQLPHVVHDAAGRAIRKPATW